MNRIVSSSFFACLLPVVLALLSMPANGQLKVVAAENPVEVLAGAARSVPVTLTNAADTRFVAVIQANILQASSTLAVPVSHVTWKQIEVPAHSTVVDSATLDFPPVKAPTKFLVQWLAGTNHIAGTTTVMVYPTNLLQALSPLAGETNLAVLDPDNQLKPLLKSQAVSFVDLGERDMGQFSGRLAVLGPFSSKSRMQEGLASRIETMAGHNVAVVWILPPDLKTDKLRPSFYLVPKGRSTVVVVRPELVADLGKNPQSQLNLVELCRQALNPEPPVLPDLSPLQ